MDAFSAHTVSNVKFCLSTGNKLRLRKINSIVNSQKLQSEVIRLWNFKIYSGNTNKWPLLLRYMLFIYHEMSWKQNCCHNSHKVFEFFYNKRDIFAIKYIFCNCYWHQIKYLKLQNESSVNWYHNPNSHKPLTNPAQSSHDFCIFRVWSTTVEPVAHQRKDYANI